MNLYLQHGVDPAAMVLYPVPRLEADLADGARPDNEGLYSFVLRVVGCPACTTQVVFFTDDEDFVEVDSAEDETDYEGDLCYVVRGTPIGANRVLTTGPDD